MTVMQPIRLLQAGALLAGFLAALPIPTLKHAANAEYFLYVGSGANPSGEGLRWYRFSPADESVSLLGSLKQPAEVNWLVRHPGNKFVYAVSPDGTLSGFAIQRGTGNLRLLGKVQTKGKGPCFVGADHKGWMLLVANCGSGNIESFRVEGDGGVGESSALQQHSLPGARPSDIAISPDNFFILMPDLDRIFYYRFDPSKATFWPNEPASLALKPGSGPKVLTIRPDEKFAYATDEPGSAVDVFAYKRDGGTLEFLDSVSTGTGHPSNMGLDGPGRYLYVANKGDNSVTVLAVDGKRGGLKVVQRVPVPGGAPGYLQVDPTGRLLMVANPEANRILLYEIDRKTGSLKLGARSIEVPAPSCFQVVPVLSLEGH